MTKKIKVVVVDDSALIRRLLTDILNGDPDIEVAAAAVDPYDAREKIKLHNPDVVTLDIEMPRMDGLSFLEKIMSLRPMPVVMISTLTEKGADATLQALELGAVDYIAKPKVDQAAELDAQADMLRRVVKNAARARVRTHAPAKPAPPKRLTAGPQMNGAGLIAIGASTGGVEALREIVAALPAGLPPIVITQHMPAAFTGKFATRMDAISALSVKEAVDGMVLEPGTAVVAPGDRHLVLRRRGASYVTGLDDGPAVSGHKPSVDVLFKSVAEMAGKDAIGIILTGMGRDGAQGLLRLRETGARTIGQDEASCVVYGMPKAAFQAGAVQVQEPLAKIAERMIDFCRTKGV